MVLDAATATLAVVTTIAGIASWVILFFVGDRIKNITGDAVYNMIVVLLFMIGLFGISGLSTLLTVVFGEANIFLQWGKWLPAIIVFGYILMKFMGVNP